ncbi:MAG TPA: TOMM precursor leader peptide-binding protein, partial [Ktedonobacteraceae bacterium]|nr:TOMM precursor leader peptide-binding protein [Ktedonobacteraceae bacterium]
MDTQEKSPGLMGSGLLYQAIIQQLRLLQQPFQQLDMDQLADGGELNCSLLVVINDDWQPQSHQQINRYSLQYHLPWLRVGVEAGRGIIGPCTLPWESGCATCADNRRHAAMEDATEFLALQEQHHDAMKAQEYSWLTAFHRDILAYIVIAEIRAFSHHPAYMRTYNALLLLQGENLRTTIHPFLPDPLCPDCSHLPEDSAEAAIPPLQTQQKLAPFTYRIRQLTDNLEGLHKRYVDEQTGMVQRVTRDRGHFYANVIASIGLYGGTEKESGFGRALSYGASQGAAIAEALERYAGIQPTGKQTVVRASYRQLAEQALDPITLGLHSVEQYAMP